MLKQLFMVCGFGVAVLATSQAPAQAQSNVCEKLGPLMQQRQALMQRVNSFGRKRIDPNVACKAFGDLASNGARTIAFVSENKDWCQIPDDFVSGITTAQKQIATVRGQACKAASQQAQLLRQARQRSQQAQGDNSSFSGVDGFSSGPWRVPQGAL